jgi:selenide,water dikinase
VAQAHLKQNDAACAEDLLILTKPLGIGIHTTAEKQGKLQAAHRGLATELMCQSNQVGALLAKLDGVHALTDVTGFGLAGHLMEMCRGSNLCAILDPAAIPELPGLDDYIALGCVPGGTQRNFDALENALPTLTLRGLAVLCDPQTSGGLLIAVSPDALGDVQKLLIKEALPSAVLGLLAPNESGKSAIHLQAG